MTPSELQNSDLYQQAINEFDATIADVADAVAGVSSDKVRGILDRWKDATHQLLKAHRLQVIDDCAAVVATPGPAQAARLREIEQRLDVLDDGLLGSRRVRLSPPGHDDPESYTRG